MELLFNKVFLEHETGNHPENRHRFDNLTLTNSKLLDGEPYLELIYSKEYQKIISEFIENYKSEFRRSDIDYSYFNTASPLDLSLTNYLSKREKLQT